VSHRCWHYGLLLTHAEPNQKTTLSGQCRRAGSDGIYDMTTDACPNQDVLSNWWCGACGAAFDKR
jgi:hypothetical protein